MIRARDLQRGAAVVEFAVLLLLLLVMLFGVAEYGCLWLQSHYLESSVREGARTGARVATLSQPPNSILNLEGSVRPAVEGVVRTSLAGLYGDRVDTLIKGIAIDGPGNSALPTLTVTVTVDSAAYWTPVVGSLLGLLPGCREKVEIRSLSASATFAIEAH